MPRRDAHRIEDLHDLNAEALRRLWEKTYPSPPPAFARREFLIRVLAHALQERAHRALSKTALSTLRELSGTNASTKASVSGALAPILRPGARLVRTWGGVHHEVIVMDRGFAYRGTAYASLSEIAKQITGAHWSGPRFFGLRQARSKATSGDRA